MLDLAGNLAVESMLIGRNFEIAALVNQMKKGIEAYVDIKVFK
ncbi:hypothetical protein LBYZC6_38610 [Lacrimispora brassicae]